MIRMGARFYDGNWPYWSHRQENYPGTPTCLNKAALKRQKGKCQFCKDPFEIGQKKLTNSTYKDRTGKERNCVAHHNCAPSLNETSASPSVRSLVQAQCAETRLLGFNGASPVKGM